MANTGKEDIRIMYGISNRTLRKWLTYLKDNYRQLAENRNEPAYLAFEEYTPAQKLLTPKQFNVVKIHYGTPS